MGVVHRSLRKDINWLADGPIGPYVEAFKLHLTERRYAAHTVASYVAGITHFARWVRSRRLRLHRIDEEAITEFLDVHLPNCNCAGPTRHDRGDHGAALGHLLRSPLKQPTSRSPNSTVVRRARSADSRRPLVQPHAQPDRVHREVHHFAHVGAIR